MARRVFIIHGWGGSPQNDFLPWLKAAFEARGFETHVPAMPDTEAPEIDAWVAELARVVGAPDAETFFVGHSIGCQTILRYLETLPTDAKIGGAVFIAGWFTLMNLETAEERAIAAPWIETPMNFEKIKSHCQHFTAIFSDNDPCVPAENKKFFEDRLGAHTILEHARGHFCTDDGVTELPAALKAIQILCRV